MKFRRSMGWLILILPLILTPVGLVIVLAQNVGPITSGRIAWYDYSYKCPDGQLTCAQGWRYLKAAPGSVITPDPAGSSDGILWMAQYLPGPGTNPAPATNFYASDFRVDTAPDGSRTVSIKWGHELRDNLACPEYTLQLFSITEQPYIFWVFRNGVMVDPADWQLVQNSTTGGDWLIRFGTQAQCPYDRVLVIYLLESELWGPAISP